MSINFAKYAEEGHHFTTSLAAELGHPEEISRTGILMRAVLHVLRERLTIAESFNLLSQFPMFLKGLYVDNWKYHEKPLKLKSKQEFLDEVEKYQAQYGESDFSWNTTTEKLVQIVFKALNNYISEGEFEDVIAQMPLELKAYFRESLNH